MSLVLLLPQTADAFVLPCLTPDVVLPELCPEVKLKNLSVDEVEPVAEKPSKPEVILYTTANCPACVSLKNKLSCVPAISFVEQEPPAWVTSVPVFHWQADDGRWWTNGNNGRGADIQDFVEEYNETCPSQTEVVLDVIRVKELGYPLRGRYWYMNQNFNPSKSQLVYHLKYENIHRGVFDNEYLESLEMAELQSLHADHHEGSVNAVAVRKDKSVAPRPQPTRQKVYAQSYTAPKRRFFRRQFRSRGGCPGGSCPL